MEGNSVNAGKRVVVTGASGGIGRAVALAAARAGYAVTAHWRSGREKIDSLLEEIRAEGGQADEIRFDVADREECAARLGEWAERNGAPWGVVLSAGICRDGAFPALSDDDWDRVLDTNLGGFYNVMKPLVMPMCRRRRGRIVAVSSVSGVIGNRGQTNYAASKAGLIGAAKSLAVELASRRITVNCIAPGFIETEMTADAPLDKVLPMIPLGRAGTAEEVAALAVFLLGEGAAYITRQVIGVNGGLA